SVPVAATTAVYHHFEPVAAAKKASIVADNPTPRTILYSCCGPANPSINRSAACGLRRASQSARVTMTPKLPHRLESCRPITMSLERRTPSSAEPVAKVRESFWTSLPEISHHILPPQWHNCSDLRSLHGLVAKQVRKEFPDQHRRLCF